MSQLQYSHDLHRHVVAASGGHRVAEGKPLKAIGLLLAAISILTAVVAPQKVCPMNSQKYMLLVEDLSFKDVRVIQIYVWQLH